MKKIFYAILSIILIMTFTVTSAGFTSIPVKSIKFNNGNITVNVGQTFTLKVIITPSNASNKNLIFSTSNKKIAAVDKNGKITAVKAGNAVITVVSSSDKKISAKCYVTVSQAKIKEGPVTYPIVSKKITLKVMYPGHASQGVLNDLRVVKEWEKMTNVHIEWNSVIEGLAEKMSIAFATGDLPDIFMSCLSVDDEEKYGPQGELIALNELIKKYSPNYKKLLEVNPQLKHTVTALDGNIYSLGGCDYADTAGIYKLHINKEWLSNLNLKMPKTVDEFHDVLKSFKTGDPNKNGKADEIPLNPSNGFLHLNGTLLAAFGETTGYGTGEIVNIKDDGIVRFIQKTNAYKQYLMYLNKLYKEGLLYNGLLSQSEEERMAMAEKNLIGVVSYTGGYDWTKLDIVPPLTSSLNSTPLATGLSSPYRTGYFSITKKNKYPEISMKWIDMFARDVNNPVNGMSGVSFWLGQEGVDWQFNDPARNTYSYKFTPPQGESSWSYFKKYIGPGWGFYNIWMTAVPANDPYSEWVVKTNREVYYPAAKNNWVYPSGIRAPNEEVTRRNNLYTDLRKYIDSMEAKFVVGEESFNNWDKYLKTLDSLRVDELVKILQDEYNRFIRK